ncbi:unnamed protein product, partial [Chrysoparadoxa australica]
GGTGVITLNRPKALNALSLPMLKEIRGAWLPDPSLNLIILKGSGERAFCAGGDVKSLAAPDPNFQPGQRGYTKIDFFWEEYCLDYALGSAKKDYSTLQSLQVSIWDGVVMGGGVGISLPGGYRVATEKSLWAMPETAIGLFPDVGSSYFLTRGRLGESGVGLYLGLTSTRLKAADLMFSGLATHYVESTNLNDLEAALLDCNGSERELNDALNEFSSNLDQPANLANANALGATYHLTDNAFVSHMTLQLEAPGSAWARETLSALLKLCPMSLKTVHEQMRRGERLDLKEVFEMEYRVMQRVVISKDFQEGVRARLIDNDGEPQWSSEDIYHVTDEEVQALF